MATIETFVSASTVHPKMFIGCGSTSVPTLVLLHESANKFVLLLHYMQEHHCAQSNDF